MPGDGVAVGPGSWRVRAGPGSWRVRVGLVVALALATAACGIPTDARPHSLAAGDVPSALLNPPVSSTTTTAPSQVAVVHVYLLDAASHLVAVDRLVGYPAPLAAVLKALVDGPSTAESAAGDTTAVPAQTVVLGASVSGGVATVDLSASFGQLVGPAQLQAVAQVVWTATDPVNAPGVTGVQFQLAGQPVPVPVPGGGQTTVATRAQYASLAPH